MKRILLFAAAIAGLISAASCQQENLEPIAKANKVTYTVQVADAVGTKALGDDVKAVNQLVYEVWRTQGTEITAFDAEKDNLLYQRTAKVDDGVATIELEFVNDQNFTVLFWAHTAGNNVYNVEHLTNVTIDSPDVANNPNAQAFVGRDFVRDCVSDKGGKVTLTRPVAQLNIGTTYASLDAFNPGGEADVTITGSSVEVTGLSTSYNVATLAAGEASKVAYKYNYDDSCRLPSEPLNVNGTDYKYVAMNYVGFPANDGSNVTVTYVINTSEGDIDNADAPIANVPVKANYRTNIIGNLITSKTDYIVTLDKKWDGIYETVEVWNGSEVNEPKKSATDDKIYEIEYASELAWLAAAVNGTLPETKAAPAPQDFAGKTFKLMNDIDLCGYEWTPIGNGSGKHFMGTFDGQYHTIKGLTITKHDGHNPKALFGIVSGSPTIKNLVIDGASVVMPAGFEGDYYAAGLVGSYYGTLTVENVTVKNSTFVGNNKVAGLLAHDGVCSNLKIDNCHVLNCNISSTNLVDGGNVGGLLGLFQGEADGEYKITRSSVKDSRIVGINSSNTGKRANGEFIACINSEAGQTLVIENCEVENNTFSQTINGTEPVTYVGPYDNKFVGGERNGYEVLPGVVIIDGAIYVTSAANLQAVLNAATSNVTVKFGADIVGNVTVNQKSGVNVTIDGLEKKYDGVIYVDGKNNYPSTETLTLTDINFETTYSESAEWRFIEGLKADNSYPHNITIDGCTFTNTVPENYAVASIFFEQFYNLTVKDCEATNMHSLLQAQSCDNNVTVENVTVNAGKNGVSFGNTKTATISRATIDAVGYGVRADGTDMREVSLTVTGCTIDAYIPVVVRRLDASAQKFTLNVDASNNLTKGGDYHVAMGSNEYEEGVAPIKPVSKYELNVADKFNAFPAPVEVATWDEFTAALAAGEDWIKLTADITNDKSYTISKNATIDLNGKTLEISDPSSRLNLGNKNTNTKVNVTIKNGGLKCKVYAQKGEAALLDIKFGGTIAYTSDAQGVITVGSSNLLAERCDMSQVKANAAATRPRALSTEGLSSGYLRLIDCNFPSGGDGTGSWVATKLLRTYINPLSGNAILEISNCKFGVAANIELSKTYVWDNLDLTNCSGGFTFVIGRASTSFTDNERAIMTTIKNNNSGEVRLDWTDVQKMTSW